MLACVSDPLRQDTLKCDCSFIICMTRMHMQVASMVSSFAENMAGSYILRVSAVNCAEQRNLCTRKGVKGTSEIRVRPRKNVNWRMTDLPSCVGYLTQLL